MAQQEIEIVTDNEDELSGMIGYAGKSDLSHSQSQSTDNRQNIKSFLKVNRQENKDHVKVTDNQDGDKVLEIDLVAQHIRGSQHSVSHA